MTTSLEEVWALFREVAQAQKETDRKFQETDRKFQETDRNSQETDRRIKQVSEQIGKLGNRLGEFVEGLVKPSLVRLFQDRGIAVYEVHADVEVRRSNEGLQIDLLVINSTEAVLVEVKSKLTPMDVQEHLERLDKFKRLMPRYADVRAMGAVAAMVIPEEVSLYAVRQGLFVLAQSGDSVVIVNDEAFQPRQW